MRCLLGTGAYARHVQQMALALHEAGALGAYHAGGVDVWRRPWTRVARGLVGRAVPRLDRELGRRGVTLVPDALVHPHWGWELPRTLVSRMRPGTRAEDWLWERGERRLDRLCARLLESPDLDAFVGVEHGSLAAIDAARRLGKPSVLAFLSPHHAMRERWVDREYERFPELATPVSRRLLALGRRRDARRDEEARRADVIVANSEVTRRSLVEAGVEGARVVSVPLGAPPALADATLPVAPVMPLRFVYVGPVSVRKGAHHLLAAWSQVAGRSGAELHLYGQPLLPERSLRAGGSAAVFHGSVPWTELTRAYARGAALVFPSLCDGFGEVVTEALAHGLPVITTPNAGASALLEEGRSGFLVPAGDVQALAERLEWCIEHPAELLAMRRHALAAARRRTWAHFRADLRLELARALGVGLGTTAPELAAASS